MTLTGSTISNNSASIRGGIDSYGGNVSLTNCTVSGNLGGGIGLYGSYFGPFPTLTVTGSTISGNSGALYGGGILSLLGNVTVSNSVISNNTASSSYPGVGAGGGIDMESFLGGPTPGADVLTITGTTFSGNQAGVGGAIATSGAYATLSVTGSSFIGNTANGVGSADGGAMDLVGLSQGTITGSLFIGNQAIGSPSGGNAAGGAIEFNSQGGFAPGTLTIQGSTFEGNTAQGRRRQRRRRRDRQRGGDPQGHRQSHRRQQRPRRLGRRQWRGRRRGDLGHGQLHRRPDLAQRGRRRLGRRLRIRRRPLHRRRRRDTLKNTQVVGNSASTAGNNMYGP